MWIEIDEKVFQSSKFKGLNYLYQILSWYPDDSIPRYNIFVDVEKVKHTENYKKLKGVEVKFDDYLNKQFDEFIINKSKAAKRDYVIQHQNSQKKNNCFEIEEAIRFFSQPVSIVLENNKNDSCFIAAIIHHFDKRNEDGKYVVREHLKNGWIKFENSGGCTNLENFIEGFLSIFDTLAAKNNKKQSDYFRGFIILDSDIEYPTKTHKHSSLIANLNSKGVRNIHILKKRMMENYMPDEVFSDLKNSPPNIKWKNKYETWIDSYLNLTDIQKDYLKMEPNKFHPNNTTDKTFVMDLYNGISQSQIDIFNGGFYYIDKDEHKNKFPLLFLNSSKVNKHTLNTRCSSSELQDILNEISKLL